MASVPGTPLASGDPSRPVPSSLRVVRANPGRMGKQALTTSPWAASEAK